MSGEWQQFLQRHTDADGRVIDNGASHSEGQGFGMLLAAHFGDRDAFERFWGWTRRNLMVREDGLLAWRWTPQAGIADRNNATDGDLLVAWALARAAAQWSSDDYRAASASLARAVREKLTRPSAHGPLLLPGAAGFEHDGVLVLNLSYWVFPALQELARVDPAPAWPALVESGERLLAEARFGRWGLPPDWLRYGGKLAPAEGRPPRFGFDAVRVPLYLMWMAAPESALEPYSAYWGSFLRASSIPAWTDLTNNSVDPNPAMKGVRAIAAATLAYPRLERARLPETDRRQSYYSDALLLLTKAMRWERAAH